MGVNKVVYTKVTVDDEGVKVLAEQLGVDPKAVAAMVNGERYRKAYNKLKLEQDKKMREWFKAHPEMMPKDGDK